MPAIGADYRPLCRSTGCLPPAAFRPREETTPAHRVTVPHKDEKAVVRQPEAASSAEHVELEVWEGRGAATLAEDHPSLAPGGTPQGYWRVTMDSTQSNE